MADRYWVGGSGTWSSTSTTNWSATSGGAGGASVPTTSDNVFFDQAGTYTVTCSSGPLACLDITVSAGKVTFSGSGVNHTIAGNISFISGTVWSVSGTITSSVSTGTATIQTSGTSLRGLTIVGAGTRQFLGAVTLVGTLTHSAGTLDLNNYTCSIQGFVSTSATTRAIAFGTGNITLTGAYTGTGSLLVWNANFSSGFSYTGTPTVNIANTTVAGKGIAITMVGAVEANALDFNFTSGAYDLTEGSSPSNVYRSVNLTGFSGTLYNYPRTFYGGFNAGSSATFSATSSAQTFAAASGTWGLQSNGKTLNFLSVVFDGSGGTWQLQDAVSFGVTVLGSPTTVTLTRGTLDLNGYTLTAGAFSSSNSNVRSVAFGTGQMSLGGTGTTIWSTSTATNFSFTGTFKVIATYTGSADFRGFSQGFTSEALLQPISTAGSSGFILNTSSTDTINLTGSWGSIDLTGALGTFGNQTRTVYGGFNAGSTMTIAAGTGVTTFAATSGVWDINGNGRTCDFPFTFNGVGGTWRFQSALTSGATRTATLTNGTLNLNGYTFTTGLFSSTNSNVRSIAFGTGSITVIGAGTVWTTSTSTNLSISGTPTVNVSNNSATATTVIVSTATTESTAFDFNFTTGTYVLTETGLRYRSLNLTGFAGTFSNNARTLYGGFNAGSTATMTAGTNVQTFAATSGTWGITRNGRTIDFPFTFNGIGGTWQLQDDFTLPSARAFTLTNGTFDINSQTTSIGVLTLPASTARSIANGVLTCASVTHTDGAFAVGSGYNISTAGTYTFTAGTLTINDGVAMPVGAFSSSNSNVRTIAFGTGQISLTGNSRIVWDTLTATNFAFTGTFKVVATYAGATGTRTFVVGGTEATAQSVSTAGSSGFILDTTSTDSKALQGSFNNFDLTGVNGTFQNMLRTIFGDFNAGSTVTFLAGFNSTTFAATSGTKTVTTNGRTLDFPLTFNGVGGTWQLQDALTSGSTRTSTLTAGTLDLNGFTYTTGLFSVTGTGVRSIVFGTGNLTLNGSGTVWNATTLTNFTRTGAPTVNVSNNSATATTVTTGTPTEVQALDFNYTTGTYALTDTSAVYRSLNLTGFAGTFPSSARTIYGNFNVGSTATMTAGANAQTFAATSGTWNITTNGRTLDFPLTFNGSGGTWQLQGALTIGSTRALVLGAGTFDANNYNVTVGTVASNNSLTRTLALGSGTWTVVGTGASAWTFATSTNATVTGTATISMTGATAKTFAGGGLAWPILNQGGAGALTVSGNNTFTDITSTRTAVGPCTISFTAGSTQSVSNFSASGTASGQLTLGSTSTTPYNLVKLGGGDVNVSYCTISYSNVSP